MHRRSFRRVVLCPGVRGFGRWMCGAALALGCTPTVDSLGGGPLDDASAPDAEAAAPDADSSSPDGDASPPVDSLLPRQGPSAYQNWLLEIPDLNEALVSERIDALFQQLFYGDPATEAVYFHAGSDQAFILDVIHGDVRTEGIGFGMMIAVQLGKRQEFDALWRYAESALKIQVGPNKGYYSSFCDTANGPVECIDPFGHEFVVTALMFADGRWGGAAGDIDYAANALRMLDVMRHKEDQNGGVVEGVTNMFDPDEHLPFDAPQTSSADTTRPAIVMPAFYEIWAQTTGDSFWKEAARSGRAYFKRTANTVTGLVPTRSRFDGTPIPGWDMYGAETYRAQLNIVLDQLWFASDPWNVEEANRLLAFFASEGDRYGASYTLDGEVLDPAHVESLVAINGATAAIATDPSRTNFISELWLSPIPVGDARYYGGLLQLMAIMVLSGEFQIY